MRIIDYDEITLGLELDNAIMHYEHVADYVQRYAKHEDSERLYLFHATVNGYTSMESMLGTAWNKLVELWNRIIAWFKSKFSKKKYEDTAKKADAAADNVEKADDASPPQESTLDNYLAKSLKNKSSILHNRGKYEMLLSTIQGVIEATPELLQQAREKKLDKTKLPTILSNVGISVDNETLFTADWKLAKSIDTIITSGTSDVKSWTTEDCRRLLRTVSIINKKMIKLSDSIFGRMDAQAKQYEKLVKKNVMTQAEAMATSSKVIKLTTKCVSELTSAVGSLATGLGPLLSLSNSIGAPRGDSRTV